ncbi:LacI family DNA-binding transcriptional regulator [Celeribacter sp.]|uniref:LacI family DNA-binding transcriptional regulator n=1 Tax=Celeribacter sp. TaxID=1890673 RepID=UPI003A8EC67F
MTDATPKPRARRSGVTLKQIADRTGVSATTISRVLNFDSSLSIGDETRQKIIETAEALNYEPPRRRKRLALKEDERKISLFHFLRPDQELVDPYYIAMRIGIETKCRAVGLDQVKFYSGDALDNLHSLGNLGGCIAIGHHSEMEIDKLRKAARHLVIADHMPLEDDVDAVVCDRAAAMRKLLRALDAAGYTRIAFAGWSNKVGNVDPYDRTPEFRHGAYLQWMEERERYDPDLVKIGVNTEQSGHELTLDLLKLNQKPDVIVTANDNMAIGAYRAISEAGLSVPEDISVASFNDISAAQFMNPPLTTVRLPAERIGENAVELLVERMAGRQLAKRISLESKIVWRGSTRTPETD